MSDKKELATFKLQLSFEMKRSSIERFFYANRFNNSKVVALWFIV